MIPSRAQLAEMEREHDAWLKTGVELKKLGLSWNDTDLTAFHSAVVAWGESLVKLRVGQREHHDKLSKE